MAQILRLFPPPALLPHEVGGKAPAKAVLVHHPDLPWDQSTQMRRISLWWLIVRSLHKNCPWLKEAVSPKFTPTPLLVNVGDTKSWPPCFNWDNPAGTFQLQSSWLAETSVATASQFSFSPCPILLPSLLTGIVPESTPQSTSCTGISGSHYELHRQANLGCQE